MSDATYNNQDVFAKTLRGELFCIKVYESDHIIVFIDIVLQAGGRVPVLPKEGTVELFDLLNGVVLAAVRIMCKLTCAVRATFTPSGIAIFQLNDSAVGQTVLHAYPYVLPCYSDTLLQSHARVQAGSDKLKAQAEEVIAALQAE